MRSSVVTTTLTLDGSALFDTVTSQGFLLNGGGTNQVEVEFDAGLVVIDISDSVEELVTLGLQDSGGFGTTMGVGTTTFDFEADNGGFGVTGTALWEWGQPTSGPTGAASGFNLWATNLGGNYANFDDSSLVSPEFTLGSGQSTFTFASWFQTENTYRPSDTSTSR